MGMKGRTLWSPGAEPNVAMLAYTIGDDPVWDARLLRWDILGSLGHAAGLRTARLLSEAEYRRLRAGLRAALRAVEQGRLVIGPGQEDAHTAVESWLTRRDRTAGERLHTGRSRNDQVTVDLRLFLKHTLLELHASGAALAGALTEFAAMHRCVLWPGYTHQRRAMPSSVALWAGALAEGLLDTLEDLPALWRKVDRSPLGSAAGYGVPLPLQRERTARALGFAGIDRNVASVQNGRGKLEASVLGWCTQLGHDLSRLAIDAILYSAEEFGYLVLPAELATGSSIMPHKRNPDLFELTRARAAALDGDLAAMLLRKGKLGSGYHRDFQLLKEPLFNGLDRTREMLGMMTVAVPMLGVDRARCAAALQGGALATDEVMRRVEAGVPFRRAYRDVAAGIRRGESFDAPSAGDLMARRRATGGVGNVGLPELRARRRAASRWHDAERRRFDAAMRRLAGR
jgi:argininosuccinate lyase